MRFKTLTAWLQWLEKLHPVEIDLGLARVKLVAEHLVLRHFSATVITVAGTNGKGSTVAALQALLSQPHNNLSAPQVGAYTSPHLISFTERIVVNGEEVAEFVLCQAFEDIDQARINTNTSLTYFEFATLAALWVFARQPLDYILLEVGLGGRLDAVNIVDADIAVISQIDIDHESWLGNDREKIGFEKAGILRAGQLAVIADANPPQSLCQRLDELVCNVRWPQHIAGANHHHGFDVVNESGCEFLSWHGIDTEGARQSIEHLPRPKLAIESWSAALQVGLMLNIFGAVTQQSASEAVNSIDVASLMANVQLAGRLTTYQLANRQILLDVAHNQQSIQRMANYLSNNDPKQRRVAIFAAMADKDIAAMLDLVLPLFDRWYLPALQNCPRAATPDKVRQLLIERHQLSQNSQQSLLQGKNVDLSVDVDVQMMAKVEESLLEAIHSSTQNDKIVVFGSFYTVGEALVAINAANAGNLQL